MLGTGDKDHGWRGEQGGGLISLNTHQARPRTLPPSFRGRQHLLGLFMGEGWVVSNTAHGGGGGRASGPGRAKMSSPGAPPTCVSVSLLSKWGHEHIPLCRTGGVHI